MVGKKVTDEETEILGNVWKGPNTHTADMG